MADDLRINITATDNASKAFVAVERSAKEMGDGIEDAAEKAGGEFRDLVRAVQQMSQAVDRNTQTSERSMQDFGRTVTQVSQSIDRAADQMAESMTASARQTAQALEQVETSAEQSGRSLRDFSSAGQTAGQGLGLLAGAFTMYANQARANEVATANLSRTYGDAAQQFIALADRIQSTTIFSNDEVIQAASSFAVLRREYGLTDQQIQQLITVSTDLAAVKGISLVDASERVQAAIRGETESAEYLGLALNQSAIDIEGVTTSMSNAEAGAFRFNAVIERGAFAQGEAARQAEDLTGKTQQLANRAQDAAARFVEWTGPVGDVTAGLAAFGLQGGLAASGLIQLTRGLREATTAAGGLGPLLRALASSPTVGLAALAVGAGAAVIGFRELAREIDGDFNRIIANATETSAQLDAAILSLTGTLTDADAVLGLTGLTTGLDQVQTDLARIRQLQQEIDLGVGGETGVTAFDIQDEEFLELQRQRRAELDALIAKYGDTEAAAQQWASAESDLAAILVYSGAGAEGARDRAQELTEAFNAGTLSLTDYAWQLNWITENYQHYAVETAEATAATDDFATAQADLRNEINLTTVAIGEYLSAQNPGQAAGALFIENAKQIEEVLGIIQTAMEDGVANSPYDLFGGQAAFAQLQSDLMAIQTSTEAGAGVVRYWADQLTEAFLAGRLTADQYANGIRELSERSEEFAAQAAIMAWEMEHNSVTAQEFADAMGIVSYNLGESSGALDDTSKATAWMADQFADANDVLLQFLPNLAALGQAVAALREDRALTFRINDESDATGGRPVARPQADALYDAAQAADIFNRRATETTFVVGELGALVDANTLPWAEYQQALAGVADQFGILSTNARLFQAAGIESPSLDVAVNLQGGGDALDSVFGTIVGQTNRMSQQLGSVESWADKLIGDPGTWSELDKLLEEGRIDINEYNEAQESQIRISTDVANAQRDLLAVQANLTPVIADATRRQAEYIDSLQDMDDKSQLAALGFMDQAESARALEVAQLAAASSTEAQRTATTEMITQMVAADPVLGAMLEKMGLISIGADGTVTVNFDDAVSATESIDNLNSSIEDLTALLEQIFNIDTATDAPASQRLIENLTGAVNDIPGSKTVTVNLIDNASYQVSLIREAMDLLDGKTATTFINTVYSTSGTKAPGLRHGGIAGYADGGVIASLAEAGPELLRFQDGGTALVPHPGVYMVEAGTSVLPAPATRAVVESAANRRGGGGNQFYGPVVIQPASNDLHAELSGMAIRRGR